MSKQEELVRKAVFVPPALWHRVKVDAVQQEVDISEIIVDALKQYYDRKNGMVNGKSSHELMTAGNGNGH